MSAPSKRVVQKTVVESGDCGGAGSAATSRLRTDAGKAGGAGAGLNGNSDLLSQQFAFYHLADDPASRKGAYRHPSRIAGSSVKSSMGASGSRSILSLGAPARGRRHTAPSPRRFAPQMS